jgi:hypothetical protein
MESQMEFLSREKGSPLLLLSAGEQEDDSKVSEEV